MKDTCGRICKLFGATLALACLLALVASAQTPSRQDDSSQKPTTTVDAWREALPQGEETTPASGNGETAGAGETIEQIERRLLALEQRWAGAVKMGDAATLKRVLSDDFTFAGGRAVDALADKTQYIERALADTKRAAPVLDRATVRVYGETAVVNAWYKQLAADAAHGQGGSLLVTDVWIKQGRRWRAVSRHASGQSASQ